MKFRYHRDEYPVIHDGLMHCFRKLQSRVTRRLPF